MKIAIASDHAGFPLKEFLKKERPNVEWVDLGPKTNESVDYPDFADLVAKMVRQEKIMGVLVCGSGQGMAIRANRYAQVRAALVWDVFSAKLSREHNDANILCLGSRLIPQGLALEIFDVWTKTPFAGGRHQARVDKLKNPC